MMYLKRKHETGTVSYVYDNSTTQHDEHGENTLPQGSGTTAPSRSNQHTTTTPPLVPAQPRAAKPVPFDDWLASQDARAIDCILNATMACAHQLGADGYAAHVDDAGLCNAMLAYMYRNGAQPGQRPTRVKD